MTADAFNRPMSGRFWVRDDGVIVGIVDNAEPGHVYELSTVLGSTLCRSIGPSELPADADGHKLAEVAAWNMRRALTPRSPP